MTTELICGERTASCHCSLLPGHDGPHECHREGCGGSWTYDEHGERVVVRLPDGGPLDLLASMMFGVWGD